MDGMALPDATPPPRALTLDEATAMHLALLRHAEQQDDVELSDESPPRPLIPRLWVPPCPECSDAATEIFQTEVIDATNTRYRLTFRPCGHQFDVSYDVLELAPLRARAAYDTETALKLFGSARGRRIPHPRVEVAASRIPHLAPNPQPPRRERWLAAIYAAVRRHTNQLRSRKGGR